MNELDVVVAAAAAAVISELKRFFKQIKYLTLVTRL